MRDVLSEPNVLPVKSSPAASISFFLPALITGGCSTAAADVGWQSKPLTQSRRGVAITLAS